MHLIWVENNPKFVAAVRPFLRAHDLDIIPSLARAKECLIDRTFDAVLLDYDLDDGKGTELLPILNSLKYRPVVLATSSHSDGNRKLLEAGADLVCAKKDFGKIEQMLDQVMEILAARVLTCRNTVDSSEFSVHSSWDTLPEDILGVCEAWQLFMRENAGDVDDWTGSGPENLVQRLRWLVPLARRLQQRSALRFLYLTVHHAVIQLNFNPIGTKPVCFYTLFAESDGQFKLDYISDSKEGVTQEAKRGSAKQIADMLEIGVASEKDP